MGKSPQEGGAARQLKADDPTVEVDILEQTISIEGARALRHDTQGMLPSPIPRAWVFEGDPVARKKELAGSSDRLAATFMWDCTSGRFVLACESRSGSSASGTSWPSTFTISGAP